MRRCQTAEDVATVLRKVANKFEGIAQYTEESNGNFSLLSSATQLIRDLNGNTVGHWEVCETPK
jgi:hypothetical protein